MWICSQIGAREHFAVPRALQQAGRTVTLCTDFWAGPVVRKITFGKLRPLAMRCHPDLECTKTTTIHSWNARALLWEQKLRRKRPGATSYDGFIEVGRQFSECVRKKLSARNWPSDSIFFGYDTGALEAMEWCREHGIKCVLGQMDPNRSEAQLVQAEEERWRGWALAPLKVPEEYFQRRELEWAVADRIIVNSEFCRQALLKQGVTPEKLIVIPLCFGTGAIGADFRTPDSKTSTANTLRVLFLGQVILRKGVQYLMAAARLLENENIQFDVVGAVGISGEAIASAPKNVVFHGRTTRDHAADWYRQSHVFVLPTLSDGFAITQLEAMAYGLPVIATPCCGDVVCDGEEGFIVPPRDAESLARKLQVYLRQRELLFAHSAAALEKAAAFTLNRLGENLVRLESSLRGDSDPAATGMGNESYPVAN